MAANRAEQWDRVVIRLADDSGDGMQFTGDRFTSETAQLCLMGRRVRDCRLDRAGAVADIKTAE